MNWPAKNLFVKGGPSRPLRNVQITATKTSEKTKLGPTRAESDRRQLAQILRESPDISLGEADDILRKRKRMKKRGAQFKSESELKKMTTEQRKQYYSYLSQFSTQEFGQED